MDELPGRCGNCGRRLEFRQTEVREEEEDVNSKIIYWLVYGICEKCNMVYVESIIKQEREPELGEEISINWEKDAVGSQCAKSSPKQSK